jgi:hypothetical protein
VGRTYAGVLGSLAFFTVTARGLIHVGGVEETLFTAAVSLILFAFAGFIAGELADWIVYEAVRSKIEAEAIIQQEAKPTAVAKKT